jgi:Cobalt transport protein
VAVSALAASTTSSETVAALQRLGAPRWFCHLVALAARQLDVLRADFARLRRAAQVRSASGRRAPVAAAATRSLASLFVHAVERADRLQVAAELRGGNALDAGPGPSPVAAIAAPGTGAGRHRGAAGREIADEAERPDRQGSISDGSDGREAGRAGAGWALGFVPALLALAALIVAGPWA